ncbi:MFS transporter [Methylobacterium sp. SD274]|jgi:MFS family permease|uniref:Predicted arabinose efflux permease, MFS family n=1 Tax=Methylobacterium gossipiicola TaxID=582675 RepID=A0A1I2UZ62_9HYPH|nr:MULTISPECIES: MFS transporter [Methylobacterium]KQO66538.1 MFS transporter [Methylobacterium sp. Leaf89]MBO1022066.1 MFS transporter [Methylobacterium sp. SD274]MBY0258592.1 MFS transporter [Methylobacterium sp.]SFG82250.1 Predicted arabinose efflux permease, MFS family [Methylobacterium gossipiicola]
MAPTRRWPVISALGVVQILTWGSSFYLLSVLAAPMSEDTGWPLAWVIGGLSLGLLVAGLVSPRVGAFIGEHGGRPVLAFAALVLAAGLAILGLAPNLPTYLAGWLLIGLGMGTGLYDPAFATLGRLYGSEARSAITTLTLWGGFASTVCWPLSAFLIEQVGWRGTCLAYAGLHLAVTLPLVLLVIPQQPVRIVSRSEGVIPAIRLEGRERRAFLLMAGVLTLGGTVMALVSVHLITLLQARGVALTSAVAYGALIGPAQVGARIVEMAGKGRHHPLLTLSAAMILVAIGVAMLAAGLPLVGLALVLYGAGNGIYSIARGTVPMALFGPERYAPLVGRLARPGLVAQALAPSVGAVVLTHAGANATYALLSVLAVANVALALSLWRVRPGG